jgi:glycosyltransferase involved in cell wall biosynthesis
MAGVAPKKHPHHLASLMFRLAYIVTHPIQYQAPLLRLVAASGEIELKVFFLSDHSFHPHREKAFGQTFKWDVNLTDGYEWEVLPRWGLGRSTPMRPWWPVSGMKRCLRAEKFDAVWVHGWGHIGLRQAINSAHSIGLPVLLRGESKLDTPPNRTLRHRLRDAFCRRLFQHIGGCLCIGTLNREFYRGFRVPEAKLFSVPYAVDNAWFQARCREAAVKRGEFRKALGLEPERPIILFAAKFIPVKAPGNLLEAYRRAWGQNQKSEIRNRKSEMRRPYLLFVGDGPLREQLEQQAGALNGNDVRFLGFRNQTELPALYDLCDLFVLPSIHEPWGLVVNEVMNAGKPVIVSDCVGAAPDLVKPGANGWIFPHGDVPALAKYLSQAMASPDLEGMGRQSLEIINSWDFEADLRGLLVALKAVCPNRENILHSRDNHGKW